MRQPRRRPPHRDGTRLGVRITPSLSLLPEAAAIVAPASTDGQPHDAGEPRSEPLAVLPWAALPSAGGARTVGQQRQGSAALGTPPLCSQKRGFTASRAPP